MLVDILAALPMEHVVRMALLGHESQRQACSLEWVTDRMTDVCFKAVLKARSTMGPASCSNSLIKKLKGTFFKTYTAESDVANAFCTKSVLKRLDGKLHMTCRDFIYNTNECLKIVKNVPGKLWLRIEYEIPIEEEKHYKKLMTTLDKFPSCTYVSVIINDGYSIGKPIQKMPEMVFEYHENIEGQYQVVFYRPVLLNGRHIVDVLRAVCGPADVSEAELDRVRKEASEGAVELGVSGLEGVWMTVWKFAKVTA